jgi:phosphoglycolate phosphatase/putative hydrolase of the HAD superfamily
MQGEGFKIMKIYNMPELVSAFIFDMDGTLYTNAEYVKFQIDILVKRLADLRAVSFEEMETEVAYYRKKWAEEHGGKQVSLGFIFQAFGVAIAESVRWREELFDPADFLKSDPKLRTALLSLNSVCKLALVTNNPVSVAKKTLKVLGVEDCFHVIVGLDTCMETKPHISPFIKTIELCEVASGNCVSVGDRFDIDIDVPIKLGMGGVLVSGVEDVYELGGKKWNC